ncbi:hypothetical protein SAMN05444007_10594 [Cribrihabitans marinus]|uniref:Cytochrome c domain-containing protein n=1 Tax=Cribrihabitans marinus TaxID=1227549 RepID=A0A1H6ZQJ8_9RHOB|nr:cytochrome c [Cribrihabitans marinus]GGH30949.1 hypothetical protein GCM10010973_21420 [Cribrihabitans marinus]SEJ51085.1 hypothetical protein SAMN05444007_10594 [Cribrihabitans marinus]
MRSVLLCLTLLLAASASWSQEPLGLAAPEAVARTGLLKHILPRFSLKTGIRVRPDENGAMRLAEAGAGPPVFRRGGAVYHLEIGDDPRQVRFRDWLISEIGRRTIESFQPDGEPMFTARFDAQVEEETVGFEGDSAAGARLSLTHCGRCHVIGPQNRMNGLGSTPSFAVLRTLPDWAERFQQFYVLKPHGAFTQIEGVTPPFDIERPSPIHPVRMTLDDLEAILAFVATTSAADLGAPLQLQ